jgi:hypothetical protein
MYNDIQHNDNQPVPWTQYPGPWARDNQSHQDIFDTPQNALLKRT